MDQCFFVLAFCFVSIHLSLIHDIYIYIPISSLFCEYTFCSSVVLFLGFFGKLCEYDYDSYQPPPAFLVDNLVCTEPKLFIMPLTVFATEGS